MPPIAEALDLPHRQEFLDNVDRMIWPEAFETCPAALAWEQIQYLEDISPEKCAAVDAMYADYVQQRDEIRRTIVEIVHKWEKGKYPLKQEIADLWRLRGSGGITVDEFHTRLDAMASQHPANPLLQKRHDLSLETVHRMRAVFGDDELARFPLAARLCLTTW